jgi:hypothetical protein
MPPANRGEISAVGELKVLHTPFRDALGAADEVAAAAKRKFGCVNLFLQSDAAGRITSIPHLSIERDPVTMVFEQSNYHQGTGTHQGTETVPRLDELRVLFSLPNWDSMDIHEVLNPQFAEFGNANRIGHPLEKNGHKLIASFEIVQKSSNNELLRAEFQNKDGAIDEKTWKRFAEILSKKGEVLGLTIRSSGTYPWIPFEVPRKAANHPYAILDLCRSALATAYEPSSGLFRRNSSKKVGPPEIDLNLEVGEFFDNFKCGRIFGRLDALDSTRAEQFGLSATATEWTMEILKILEPATAPSSYWSPDSLVWSLQKKQAEFNFSPGQVARECPPFQEFHAAIQKLTDVFKTLSEEEQRAACVHAVSRLDEELSIFTGRLRSPAS